MWTCYRCEVGQQSHRKCHEDLRQHLSRLEARLSKCAGEQVASFDKCITQQEQAKVGLVLKLVLSLGLSFAFICYQLCLL